MFERMPLVHYSMSWLPTPALLIIAACLLDWRLGEPSRWHPLVGFGNLAMRLERSMNHLQGAFTGRVAGLLAWLMLLVPAVIVAILITWHPLGWLIDVLLLYLAIGARSLHLHAMRVFDALQARDLVRAREAVGMMVSRDTKKLNRHQIAAATVESVLENGNDAIFAAIFWFALLGGPGVVAYRLANTLDAMWGYRTPRYRYFGWAAARLDDVFNLIPARLTALAYALCGHTWSGLKCWFRQARTWYSPNAGPVMAAGAGALQVKLGGRAPYHGVWKDRPTLGMGEPATAGHIPAALGLIRRSMMLWCAAVLVAWLVWKLRHA
jgi:adenosylcobinamide-phosphate synthase